MYTKGVFNVIKRNREVLLVKRRDLPFWDLPGGTCEAGETETECLIRETEEETGLVVAPVKRVGNFTNHELKDIQVVFTSNITGGQLVQSGPETKKVRYFPVNKLPHFMIPHRRAQILLAFRDTTQLEYELKDTPIVCLGRKLAGRF